MTDPTTPGTVPTPPDAELPVEDLEAVTGAAPDYYTIHPF
jgi:hypothetical protein